MAVESMDMFEINTVMNEGALREIKYHLISTGRRIAILLIILAAVVMLILGIVVQSAFLTAVAAIAVLVFILEYFWLLNRNVKVFLKRVEETAHTREYRYSTSFLDSGMQIINHTTGSNTTISYGDIKRVKETRSFYLVFTKAGQFTLLDRMAIDVAGKKEALRAFLQSRCGDIRWK